MFRIQFPASIISAAAKTAAFDALDALDKAQQKRRPLSAKEHRDLLTKKKVATRLANAASKGVN
jgi:hypothetical protein